MRSFTSLILTVPLNQIYHKSLNKQLEILNSKDWGQKMSQSNKIDLKVFCEKLPFDSLYSNRSLVFSVEFLCVLKMYHIRLFIMEKMGFETALRQCEIHSKLQPLLQKTCIFQASETLAAYTGVCLRTHALACISTHAGYCPRT